MLVPLFLESIPLYDIKLPTLNHILPVVIISETFKYKFLQYQILMLDVKKGVIVLLVLATFLVGCGGSEVVGKAYPAMPELEYNIHARAMPEVKVGEKFNAVFYSDKCAEIACTAKVDRVMFKNGQGVWVESKDRDPKQDRYQLLWGLSSTDKDGKLHLAHMTQAMPTVKSSVSEMKIEIEYRDQKGNFIDGEEVLLRLR